MDFEQQERNGFTKRTCQRKSIRKETFLMISTEMISTKTMNGVCKMFSVTFFGHEQQTHYGFGLQSIN